MLHRWASRGKSFHYPGRRLNETLSRSYILGLETSCDDTGAAVIDLDGRLVAESLIKQPSQKYGGVIPSIAMGFHAQNVEKVIDDCAKKARLDFNKAGQISALAVTNRPGLSGSLIIGTKYAKYLSLKHNLRLIPVHHMEAHALTARMFMKELRFPYLVLLISGGHCLLALAKVTYRVGQNNL